MLILYAILVLCTVVVVGVAIACWRLVYRNLRAKPSQSAAVAAAEGTATQAQQDVNDRS